MRVAKRKHCWYREEWAKKRRVNREVFINFPSPREITWDLHEPNSFSLDVSAVRVPGVPTGTYWSARNANDDVRGHESRALNDLHDEPTFDQRKPVPREVAAPYRGTRAAPAATPSTISGRPISHFLLRSLTSCHDEGMRGLDVLP